MTATPLSAGEFEAALRAVGAERYHNLHPFHHLLHGGKLTRPQVQAWALNRYYYQAQIPVKDSIIMSRLGTPDLRRAWRSRIVDHDGDEPGLGGIARWFQLAVGVGLDADYVESTHGILPITRFAVDAYVNFVGRASVLEAVASSLTEMFAPGIIAERVVGMLAHYDFISSETLAYFHPRLTQAPKDSEFALAFVKEHARTRAEQEVSIAALKFKCDLLWAQLDGLYYAYVLPGFVPPGAYRPEERDVRP